MPEAKLSPRLRFFDVVVTRVAREKRRAGHQLEHQHAEAEHVPARVRHWQLLQALHPKHALGRYVRGRVLAACAVDADADRAIVVNEHELPRHGADDVERLEVAMDQSALVEVAQLACRTRRGARCLARLWFDLGRRGLVGCGLVQAEFF